MDLEIVKLEHVPATHRVHLALFHHVKNASFLHGQLLDRNSDFEYAFVDASVIVSRLQLLSAVFKAVHAAVSGSLQTANVHSEIVASLSTSKNISEAYRRFGISPATKNLLVVKVTFPSRQGQEDETRIISSESIARHLAENVQGCPVPATEENIASGTDLVKVRKYYKLNGISWLDALGNSPSKTAQVENLILSSMALRGV